MTAGATKIYMPKCQVINIQIFIFMMKRTEWVKVKSKVVPLNN
jgi:hypothetical protein